MEKNNWINIETEKPLVCERGDWDGERSDLILIATDRGDITIGRVYIEQIGGVYSWFWCDSVDNCIVGNITHWQELPKHPVL